MESDIKIRSSLNRMKKEFDNGSSKYYYIKYYNGSENYKGNDDEPIVFDCLIRHNEIGNRVITRSNPYTFETLEKTLKEKCEEYEKELNNKDDDYEL